VRNVRVALSLSGATVAIHSAWVIEWAINMGGHRRGMARRRQSVQSPRDLRSALVFPTNATKNTPMNPEQSEAPFHRKAPLELSADAFRSLGHQLVDELANFLE